jgi:hypothetical protein
MKENTIKFRKLHRVGVKRVLFIFNLQETAIIFWI